MNRGSLSGEAIDRMRPPTSFNEAPIHESGKCATAAAGSVAGAVLQ